VDERKISLYSVSAQIKVKHTAVSRKVVSQTRRSSRSPHSGRCFCRPTKNLALSASVRRVNSDKSATRSGLVGRYLAVLDLKTSCRTLSASVPWTEIICQGLRAPQPIRKCLESHHVSGIDAILILDDSAPNLNAVSRDKNSASVRQSDGPTNLTLTKNRQFHDKKSASVRQPLRDNVERYDG